MSAKKECMSSLLDDSIIEVNDASCSSLEESDSECPPRKKIKVDHTEELMQLARERHAMQKERGKQMEKLVSILDCIAAQNAAFQKKLLQILRDKA